MTRAVGPASIVVAALVVPLFYVPGADSPFADPKLALLLVAGGVGLGAGFSRGRAETRGRKRPGCARRSPPWCSRRLLAAIIAALRRPPGAPYALAEIVRLLARARRRHRPPIVAGVPVTRPDIDVNGGGGWWGGLVTW